MNRIRLIFKAIFSAFMGRQEEKYASEILDLTYEQLQDGLIAVKEDLSKVATAKHRIIQLITRAEADAGRFEEDAVRFLEKGDEDSARQTLGRKAIVTQQINRLVLKKDGIEEDQTRLEENMHALETRIQEFGAEKEVMKADLTAAKATANIGKTVTGLNKDTRDAARATARIQERTDLARAEGDALGELIQSGALEDIFNPGQTPLDRKALEMARDQSVDNDLARLRKQLGKGDAKDDSTLTKTS